MSKTQERRTENAGTAYSSAEYAGRSVQLQLEDRLYVDPGHDRGLDLGLLLHQTQASTLRCVFRVSDFDREGYFGVSVTVEAADGF